MTQSRPLAALSAEETQQSILYLLAEIRDRLPRLDQYDREAVTVEASVALSTTVASGTVTTVSTVGNLTQFAGKPVDGFVPQVANMGALHIYQQIVVT